MEVPWKLLEGSWRRREGFRQPFGGVLEAFEGFLDAPESILEASGGYIVNYVKNFFFQCSSLVFEILGACGTLLRRSKSIQNRVWELIMGTR